MFLNPFSHSLLKRPLALISPTFLLLVMCFAAPSFSQWTPNTSLNTEVSWSSNSDRIVKTQIEDGPDDSTYVLWDTTWGTGDVYLQLVNDNGLRMPNDTLVATDAFEPVMMTDGADGVIVVWRQAPSMTLWAARYLATVTVFGSTMSQTWGPIQISATGRSDEFSLTTDGAGGAIVSWTQRANVLAEGDIYAQRIDAFGTPLWTPGGFAVTNYPSSNQTKSALSRGSGGDAYIVWQDSRDGGIDIWIRYVDESAGNTWTTDLPVVNASGLQLDPQIISVSTTGGVLVAWMDYRGISGAPYAQRIDPTGFHLWSPWNGIRLGQGSSGASDWTLVNDFAGGGLVAWTASYDLRYQRVRNDGTLVWGPQGLAITSGGSMYNQRVSPALAPRAAGAVITWGTESRTDDSFGDVFAQYVGPASGPHWAAGGIPVSLAGGWQGLPDVVADGQCPAKVSFSDFRAIGDASIQRIICPGIAGKVWVNGTKPLSISQVARLPVIFETEKIGRLGKTGFEIVIDPRMFEFVDILPGTLHDLETDFNRESGILTVESRSGGEVVFDHPLFELEVRPLAVGASPIAFTRVDLGDLGDSTISAPASMIQAVDSDRR